MKNIILFFAWFGCFTGHAYSQEWLQTNGPYGADVMALAKGPDEAIYAGTRGGGVFRSMDNGESWTQVNNGLTCMHLWSIAVKESGVIFAGSAGCNEGVFRSEDNGESWTLVNDGLTTYEISALAVDDQGYVYAGTTPMFGPGGGVFRSVDNGDHWTEISSGLTNLFVTSLVCPGNLYLNIVAGTEGGIFNFDGNSWHDYSDGLMNNNVRAMVDTYGSLCQSFYAGTVGGGVWSWQYPIGIDEPAEEAHVTVFPDPVRDHLILSLPNQDPNQHYTVEFFSRDGRLVRKIESFVINGPIDVSAFLPGLYLIRLSSRSAVINGRFIRQ
jgi:hypothetical protein